MIDTHFNSAIKVMNDAKRKGALLFLDGESVKIKIEKNKVIEHELFEEIKKYKSEIRTILNNKAARENIIHGKKNVHSGRIPLSYSQERLWFIDRLEGSVAYHIPSVLRLEGNLDTAALERAFQAIVNRHEVLRTVVEELDGVAFQRILEQEGWSLTCTDGTGYRQDEEGLQAYIERLISRPFDLSLDYPLRAELIELDAQEHVLVVVMHHIASDAWSTGIIVRELVALYKEYTEGVTAKLPALPLQNADYALWQRKYLSGEVLEQKLAYWKQQLEGVAPLELPTDKLRPAIQSQRGASLSFSIEKALTDRLRELSQQEGVTLYMTLLSAFQVLLYRYSGQEDISVGTSIAGRDQQEIEGLIGFFVNTLVLRSRVKGSLRYAELLSKVQETVLGAYEHQDVPFEKVVEAVLRERDLGRSPLFQVMFVLENTPDGGALDLGAVRWRGENAGEVLSKFDLTLYVNESRRGLQLGVVYNRDLYEEETIRRMGDHYRQLLSSIVQDRNNQIDRLDLLTPEEHASLLSAGTSVTAYPAEQTVVELFEAQADRTPETTAVVFGEVSLSYRQLDERSTQLGRYLQRQGVRAGTLVPICMERGAEMLVGILGILKAGGAYVPIEPDYPADRIAHMLEDTGSAVIVSRNGDVESIPAGGGLRIIAVDQEATFIQEESKQRLVGQVNADALLYVLYTSGSTGRPKGVMITHRSVVDYVNGLDERIRLSECQTFGLVSGLSTDLGNTVLYGSLLLGGSLHLFSKEMVSDGRQLQAYFRRHRIDCLKIVPSHWRALSQEEDLLLPQRMLIFGGEALGVGVLQLLKQGPYGGEVYNHYGPTETTIGKLIYRVDLEREYKQLPIGHPFSNTQVYVVNGSGALCPVGVPGELWIGGAGVAQGYLHRPGLTAERFVANPFREGGGRLYRTGDICRWLEDGNIEFMGRRDDQVKIRGYRVELGEIEGVLHDCSLVRQCVVVARQNEQGEKRLISYVVPEGVFDREGILSYAKERLPEYMVPAVWVELEQLPLTGNGKIDRKALPEVHMNTATSKQYIAPRNKTEEELAAIWMDLLTVSRIGVLDDFFESGGNSILAIRLFARIKKKFPVSLSIRNLFQLRNIAALAEYIEVVEGTEERANNMEFDVFEL